MLDFSWKQRQNISNVFRWAGVHCEIVKIKISRTFPAGCKYWSERLRVWNAVFSVRSGCADGSCGPDGDSESDFNLLTWKYNGYKSWSKNRKGCSLDAFNNLNLLVCLSLRGGWVLRGLREPPPPPPPVHPEETQRSASGWKLRLQESFLLHSLWGGRRPGRQLWPASFR